MVDNLVRRTHGREAEAAQVLAAVALPDGALAACVHLHGVAGIGKTSLVDHVIELLRADGAQVARIPTEGLEPRAITLEAAFLAALAQLPEDGAQRVLVADPFDDLVALLPWLLRRITDPDVRVDALLLVSRAPLPAALQAARPPRVAHTSIELDALGHEVALGLLADLGVPSPMREEVVARIGGHPLSLCLVAATRTLGNGDEDDPAPLGRVLAAAAERLVDHVPSMHHERALLAAAIIPTLDDELLTSLLPSCSAAEHKEVQRWLAGLPFVTARPRGLVVHDAIRSVLLEAALAHDDAPLRDLYAQTFARLAARRDSQVGRAADAAIDALAFLIMRHPLVRATFAAVDPVHRVEPASAAHLREALTTLARMEGERAAELVALWVGRPGVSARAVLDADEVLRGFFVVLGPEALAEAAQVADPVVHAFEALAREVAPRARRLLVRAWFTLDGYQDPGAPWCTVVNQAMTRVTLRVAPSVAATCHRDDPVFRTFLAACFSSAGTGVRGVQVEGVAAQSLAYRFAPMEQGDAGLWALLWSDALGAPARVASAPGLAAADAPTLSEREREVLRLLADGYRYEQVAALLGLSLGTVRTYVRRTYAKLGVSTKSEATLLAVRLGILS